MDQILDYQIIEQVDETTTTIVFRAQKENESESVILKIIKAEYPSPVDIARFKQELDMIKKIESDGIIKMHDVMPYKNTFVLVLEDFKGIRLDKIIQSKKIDIETFLRIAIPLSEILGNLHKNHIVHRDIRPCNIFIASDNDEVKVTDFSIISEMTHEMERIYDQEVIKNKLAYISPEQTGRMNRQVDYRTDLYSLGIVFYELLTGMVPFASTDPLEMIHSHIARNAKTPLEVNTTIPEIISEIVMRLLSKTAEDRYQNSFGLNADLMECESRLKEKGRIEPFELARKDVPFEFRITEKLFGREKEIELLIASFDRVSQGQKEVVLIAGDPGIGKSSLVNEIYKPIIDKKGFFIQGKYEIIKRDVPYSAIIQAFRDLIRQILAKPKETINIFKEDLVKALGASGKVITDIIPEVELIIGKQPDLAELEPDGAQNRFQFVFRNFVRVFARIEHPVALFLDDLQWTDSASLLLIKNIITDIETAFLFLVGTYRKNEVPESHPLREIVIQIKDAGIKVNKITLSDLDLPQVNNLISDSLKVNKEMSLPLAILVHEKTEGNPFFVNKFMEMLYKENLIEPDPAVGWRWDIKKISQKQSADNVIDFMLAKITELPENTKEVLKICACLGNRFDLPTLSTILNKPIEEAFFDIHKAISEGLIILSDDIYAFTHDRIREAAYSLIPDEEKRSVHLKIGKIVLKKTGEGELPDKILYIVTQFNLAIELITSQEDRYELAGLNLMAGRKAKESAAYEEAKQYFHQGVELLSPEAWESDYSLSLALYTESGETAYLTGDFHKAEEYFNAIIEKAESVLDKVKVYEVKIAYYTGIHKYKEAVEVGKDALKMLGINMPQKAHPVIIIKEILLVKLNMRSKKVEDLIYLDELCNPQKVAAVRIFNSCVSPCYMGVPKYFPIILLKMLNFTLKFGNSSYGAFAYVTYGIILWAMGQIETGYRFAKVGVWVVERLKTKVLMCKVYYTFMAFNNIWKEHIKNDIDKFIKVYRYGVESGDFEFAAYSLCYYVFHSFFAGETLYEVKKKFERYHSPMKSLQYIMALQVYELWYQLVINLSENPDAKLKVKGLICDEEELLSGWRQIEKCTHISIYTVCKQILFYIYGGFEDSIEIARRGKPYLESVMALIFFVEFNFYYSLALLAHYPEAPRKEQRKYRRQVKANQKKMKLWATHAPQNYKHKYLLIEAERSRIRGKFEETITLYNKAIALAGQNGFTHEEAIANECAARYCRTKGIEELADLYIQKACYCFERWGATIKVKQLKEKYPWLLHKSLTVKSDSSLEQIDFFTVVNALQAISIEIILENLLKNLMNIMMENAGAERAFFISVKNERLYIEAEGAAGKDVVQILESIPLDERDDLLIPVVNFVHQSMKHIVLDDVRRERAFAQDPYVLKYNPKSILCLPIMRHSNLTGILYLENNVATDAFTSDRIRVLKLLASQAAISLENSRLFSETATLNKILQKEINERKEAEKEKEKLKEKLIQAHKMEAIGTLAGGIAHDFNNILMAIFGYTEMSMDKLSEDSEQYKNLKEVIKGAHRAKDLVKQILAYSRQGVSEKKPVQVSAIAKEALDFLKASLPATIEIRQKLDNDDTIMADPTQIHQVIMNLCTNAYQAMRQEGGVLDVSLSKVEVTSSDFSGNHDLKSGSYIRLTVSDTGHGMKPELLKRIFDPFFTTKAIGEGTGLGLSVVQGIIKKHEGDITVESSFGKGTTIHILLPLINTLSVEVNEESSKSLLEGTERILLVDDEEVNLCMWRQLLELLGYHVTTIADGLKALEIFERSADEFDLIITDMTMSQIRGDQLAQKLMSIRPDVPVILYTGYSDMITEEEAKALGIREYIIKPVIKTEMVATIRKVLDEKG
ncbi:MAG: AAA family ATPase [bacterium]